MNGLTVMNAGDMLSNFSEIILEYIFNSVS